MKLINEKLSKLLSKNQKNQIINSYDDCTILNSAAGSIELEEVGPEIYEDNLDRIWAFIKDHNGNIWDILEFEIGNNTAGTRVHWDVLKRASRLLKKP